MTRRSRDLLAGMELARRTRSDGTGRGRYRIATPYAPRVQVGGGDVQLAPAGPVPTVFVAAADASADSKAVAHLVCDGAGDQTEINTALDTCPAGGRVLLSEGTFRVTGPVDTVPAEGVSLSGVGGHTVIQVPAQTAGSWPIIGGSTGWTQVTIERLKLHCEPTRSGTHSGVSLNQFSDVTIRDVQAVNLPEDGFEFSNGNALVVNCDAHLCGGDGYAFRVGASQSSVLDSRARSCSGHGIVSALSTVHQRVLGNLVTSCGGNGIQVGGYTTVAGNKVRSCTGVGINASGPGGMVLIQDNAVEDSGSAGIHMFAQGAAGYPQSTAVGNAVHGAGGAGIVVDGFAHNSFGVAILANTVRESAGCGLRITSLATETYVDANDLLNAGSPVLCDDGNSTQYGTNRLSAEQSVTRSAKGVVVHGDDSFVTRPGGHASIEWIGSAEPINATDNDTWIET